MYWRSLLLVYSNSICAAVVQLMWLEIFALLASTPSMLPSVGRDTLKKIELKLCFMTTSQFPAFCLPPFSCLVTPAVWVSGPPLLSSRDAGPRRLSFLIRLLAFRRAWGQSNSMRVCFGRRWCPSVCLLLCSACIEIVGVSEWAYGCACVLTLCHYVGVWPIWLTVFQIMIRV